MFYDGITLEAQSETLSSDEAEVLPLEEANLLRSMWASTTESPFPLQRQPTRDEASRIARRLLQSKLRPEERAGNAPGWFMEIAQ